VAARASSRISTRGSRAALAEGVIPGTTLEPQRPKLRRDIAVPQTSSDAGLERLSRPIRGSATGRYANHAWLQELPKPLSQLTWDNAALVSHASRESSALSTKTWWRFTSARVHSKRRSGSCPACPTARSRSRSGSVARTRARVGDDIGVDAYRLRTSTAPWMASGVKVARTGGKHSLACTQTHSTMEGRDLVRSYSAAEADACAADRCRGQQSDHHRTLYDAPPRGPYAWAMSIDLSSCIGCGACTIACQAENNIPVVGRHEVRNGREMHWIRVDRYYEGAVDNPASRSSRCPACSASTRPARSSARSRPRSTTRRASTSRSTTAASAPGSARTTARTRCVASTSSSTRATSRRSTRSAIPSVTVRMRGVMEKCNYCLQRITTARIDADRDGRALADGDVVTACQAACPTRAIVFGDLNDPAAEVNRRKRSPLDYALLAELNTRPRTTYLARVVNRVANLESA
jgi:molybdopterin-containing oxidoreductase family iron-sulfur binding subunit